MPIKHAFVSGYPDSADKTLVKPSDWNAEHVGTSLDLEVNGTANASQTLLNLAGVNGATVTDNGSGNIAVGVGTIQESQVSGLTADLAAKAPLDSPTLTGTPTAPTAAPGNNSIAIATTAFVDAAIAALPASVPSSRQIITTTPLTGGGNLSADLTLAVSVFTGDTGSGGTSGIVPAPAAGDGALGRFLRASGGWQTPFEGARLISSNYMIAVTDNNSLLVSNSSGAITWTLPNPPVSPYWLVYVENPTPGTLTISPNGLLLDGAAGSLNVGKNQGVMIATDGTNYYSQRGMATGGGSGGGGGGTVTSVALTMPAEFAVAGSPITGFGTLAVTSNSEPANQFWAGPASGAAAAPAFRALVAADLPSGTGTVTSVGLAAPPEFTVSGSPVTGSGTLTLAKATEAANTVWAGPSSGSAAAPAFRALVLADLPPISSTTHSESLTDGEGNFIFAGGDIVTVVGVPN